jgi:hypothetical protein
MSRWNVRACDTLASREVIMENLLMKLSMLVLAAAVAIPTIALADSSQPNSAPGLEGRPVTNQGEGTTGSNEPRSAMPSNRTTTGSGTTDAGKTGHAGTRGAQDSSIPGATNPNEPMRNRN